MTDKPIAATPPRTADALRQIRDLCDLPLDRMRSEHGSEHRILMAVIPSIVDAAIEAEAAPQTAPLDVEQIVRERLSDLRSCNKDDDCETKAQIVEVILEDIAYERERLAADRVPDAATGEGE